MVFPILGNTPISRFFVNLIIYSPVSQYLNYLQSSVSASASFTAQCHSICIVYSPVSQHLHLQHSVPDLHFYSLVSKYLHWLRSCVSQCVFTVQCLSIYISYNSVALHLQYLQLSICIIYKSVSQYLRYLQVSVSVFTGQCLSICSVYRPVFQ